MKTQVVFPFAVAEYTATFERPVVEAWPQVALIVGAYLDALKQWNFGAEEVEVKSGPRLLDNQIVLQQPFRTGLSRIRISVNVAKLVMVVENPDWSELATIQSICQSSLDVLARMTKAKLNAQQLALALHIQSKTTPRREITARLLSPMGQQLLDGAIDAQGVILHRERASILIDGSVTYANALFVRIQRNFAGTEKLEQIAAAILADEKAVLDILDLVEETT